MASSSTATRIRQVEGVEPDERLVDPDSRHRPANSKSLFLTLTFIPQNVTLILMLDVLEHLDDPGAALRHAFSLLKPTGALLLTVPGVQLLWTNTTSSSHRVRYRRRTLRPLLRQAASQFSKSGYWYQWTCPAKLAFDCRTRFPPSSSGCPRASRFDQSPSLLDFTHGATNSRRDWHPFGVALWFTARNREAP